MVEECRRRDELSRRDLSARIEDDHLYGHDQDTTGHGFELGTQRSDCRVEDIDGDTAQDSPWNKEDRSQQVDSHHHQNKTTDFSEKVQNLMSPDLTINQDQNYNQAAKGRPD